MDKLPPVRLSGISTLMNCLIEKVQLIDSQSSTVKYKAKCCEDISNIVEKLKEFFINNHKTESENDSKLYNDHISRIFDQFEWETQMLTKSTSNFKDYAEYTKSFISSLLKLLGRKGCGILITETYVKICMKVLQDMILKCGFEPNLSSDISDFKSLIEALSLSSCILRKYWHIIFLQNQKNSIMLCLSQICKCLPFLLKMIEQKNNYVKKYMLERLMLCFDRMLDELHEKSELQNVSNGSEFIHLMDSALFSLNQLSRDYVDYPTLIEIASSELKVIKVIIDELLCHAMSIAQVTNIENDYKSITSSSEKVLQEFQELSSDIRGENGLSIKLTAASLSETLCQLEQKVNTAVLRLVLEVFTQVNNPLKKMVNQCRVDSDKDNKLAEDLNVLISEFDLEMDKIMQIGLFAISCSSDVKRILGIRSCLASLESLEAELIPCLTALYLDPKSVHRVGFQHLVDQWINEITDLKALIDSILDAAAFCQVVENQVENLVLAFKNEITSTLNVNSVSNIIQQILRYSKKLIKTLKRSMADDEQQQNDQKMKKLLSDLQLAIQECDASTSLLKTEEDANKIINRILKRCELVLFSNKKLTHYLMELLASDKNDKTDKTDFELSENAESFSEEKSHFSTKLPQRDYYKICTSVCDTTPDMEVLTPYLTKGKLKTKERTMLYVTPKKMEVTTLKTLDSVILTNRHWDKTPRSKNRSRCCKPLPLKLELSNSLDFEITTVLENLTDLSDTFNDSYRGDLLRKENVTQVAESATGGEKDAQDGKPTTASSGCCANLAIQENENLTGGKIRSEFLQSLDDLSHCSSLLLSKDSNDHYNTLDRLNDLKLVEQKINFLEKQIPGFLP